MEVVKTVYSCSRGLAAENHPLFGILDLDVTRAFQGIVRIQYGCYP
jgi:hypothetical protein